MISKYHQSERQENLMNAQRIQQSLLPKRRHFKRMFANSFVLYKPQDLLSGDFYWIGQKHGLRYLVVGDCTGHGISASLTSVLAINLIEYAIMNKGIKKTTKVLLEINKRFKESFKDLEMDEIHKPTIDISIICIDDELGKIFYSSANRKMLHISEKSGEQLYKPFGFPVGSMEIEENPNFETKVIDFCIGDKLYIGSDGFQDQFGGPFNKKFGSKRLHRELIMNHKGSFKNQLEHLETAFISWKGSNSQIDDVCIVAVEL